MSIVAEVQVGNLQQQKQETKPQLELVRGNDIMNITVQPSRNEKLSAFGKATLKDRYLLEGEDYQDMFVRVAKAYADDEDHAQRLYDYMSQLWYMPATPVLSNGGTDRGLPISCFLNETKDSLGGIVDMWNENVWLAARGGGIGSYWGNLRSIGEKVRGNGKTSGVIPFMRVQDSLTLAISQGSLRRGSSAMYMPIDHPEIEEFIDIRRPTGGDPNRKALNIHHGVAITDAFMHAVEEDGEWDLKSPYDGHVVETVKARELWIKLLVTRMETGEPYMLFIDNVNKKIPEHHKQLGLNVKTSNLCSEITLPTGLDHLGEDRTAVCCLSSVNLETYDEWKDQPGFIEDIMRFLDNVLQSFIETAPAEMARATYSAMRERSVGLGVMGFHSYLQSKGIPFESVMAKVWNKKMFEHIRKGADAASVKLAEERGPCEDAAEVGVMERFSNKMAIAPTASISVIGGNSSPGIEPYAANVFVQKTLSGSFTVRNKHLDKLLTERGMNNEDVWSSISSSEGSVQHLDFLDEHEKLTFKTAQEMDQLWVVEHAADRSDFVCQAQSVNLFIAPDVHKRDLHLLHYNAWKKGVKSLYYCRSTSMQRSDKVSHEVQMEMSLVKKKEGMQEGATHAQPSMYEECLACQ
jgi:ribonucleoside-diphosphate reductase alpha chain